MIMLRPEHQLTQQFMAIHILSTIFIELNLITKTHNLQLLSNPILEKLQQRLISMNYNLILMRVSLTLTLDWFLKSTAAFFFPRVLSEFSSFLQKLNVLCFLNSY